MLGDPVYLDTRVGYRVRVWRDGYFLSWLLGERYPVRRMTLVADEETNVDPYDDRSLMNVLLKAVRQDPHSSKLAATAQSGADVFTAYGIDVWVSEEYGEPGAQAVRWNWRYTPQA